MVNVYIVITLVAAVILTMVFVGLFSWEVIQQTAVIEDLRFPEWKHKNIIFKYSTGTESIPLSCPVDKHIFVNHATFQYYDPLNSDEKDWSDISHRDAWWVSYGNVDYGGAGGTGGFVGQCDFAQSIAGQLNDDCLNAKGNCSATVNKSGKVGWGTAIEGEDSVCSGNAVCMDTSDCQFSVNVSYVCTSEDEVKRLVEFSNSNAS